LSEITRQSIFRGISTPRQTVNLKKYCPSGPSSRRNPLSIETG
jgi:hypothetical protein